MPNLNNKEAEAQLKAYLVADGSIVGHEEDAGEAHGL